MVSSPDVIDVRGGRTCAGGRGTGASSATDARHAAAQSKTVPVIAKYAPNVAVFIIFRDAKQIVCITRAKSGGDRDEITAAGFSEVSKKHSLRLRFLCG